MGSPAFWRTCSLVMKYIQTNSPLSTIKQKWFPWTKKGHKEIKLVTGESLLFSLTNRQLVKFLCSSDSVECHAGDRSVCGEWDPIRMLMCCECSCFYLCVTVLWLTFAAKVFVHHSSFVTHIYTYTRLQLRFVRDDFVLEKGELLYSYTCCLCKCLDAWHPHENSFCSVPLVLFVTKKLNMYSPKCWKSNTDVIY